MAESHGSVVAALPFSSFLGRSFWLDAGRKILAHRELRGFRWRFPGGNWEVEGNGSMIDGTDVGASSRTGRCWSMGIGPLLAAAIGALPFSSFSRRRFLIDLTRNVQPRR